MESHLQKVTLDDFNDRTVKGLLTVFSEINEYFIESEFRRLEDTKLSWEELIQLEYRDDAPLFQKLIWRFRNANRNAIAFWNALDPTTQTDMVADFELRDHVKLLHFFVWVINSGCIPGYRPTQNIVEVFYSPEACDRDQLIKAYNDRLDELEANRKRTLAHALANVSTLLDEFRWSFDDLCALKTSLEALSRVQGSE